MVFLKNSKVSDENRCFPSPLKIEIITIIHNFNYWNLRKLCLFVLNFYYRLFDLFTWVWLQIVLAETAILQRCSSFSRLSKPVFRENLI